MNAVGATRRVAASSRFLRTPSTPTPLEPDDQPVAVTIDAADQEGRTAPPVLNVEGLGASFGAIRAVDDVSFAMVPGEIVALLGHSGSGKSTLLRLIAGLDHCQSGRIVIDGRDVTLPFVPPERRGVGMMFQDYALFPHLTLLANVTFGLHRMPHAEAAARGRASLAKIGLTGREGDYPHRLSGGEQQRVALARALLPRPKILLMDEPFSNLDRRTRDQIRDETAVVLRDSGTTAILVTHDPDDAMRMADRIMLMHRGRIAQCGTAEELYHRPESLLAARFFSDLNEIRGICRDGAVATPVGSFPAGELADGEVAIVCVRPRDVALDRAAGPRAYQGRVVSTAFLGERPLVTIAVEGLARHLTAQAPTGAVWERGQTVNLSVQAVAARVFRAE